jgi:hypothetical protein
MSVSRYLVISTICVSGGCSAPPVNNRVEAAYDQQTGKLRELTVDGKRDGKPNVFSFMDGTKFVRIEIDKDEDGKIDRWEYYGADQKLEKIGFSRANDGTPDSWAYEAADGSVARVEISTKRNGQVDRTEFFDAGSLSRAEQDTNGDGRPDKWETYAGGTLATVAFDTQHTGKPDRVIDYRSEPSAAAGKPQH